MRRRSLNFPVSLEIPVAWGEMDAFGHVNNVVYFRYFESVRIEFFRRLEVDQFGKGDFVPILAKTECNYLRPVHFPDTLLAEARVSRVGRSSLTMDYRLSSREQGEMVAQGEAVVVNVDPKTGRGVALPEHITSKIEALNAD